MGAVYIGGHARTAGWFQQTAGFFCKMASANLQQAPDGQRYGPGAIASGEERFRNQAHELGQENVDSCIISSQFSKQTDWNSFIKSEIVQMR
jgi:hypothetical protein